jgi:hypothetical protein
LSDFYLALVHWPVYNKNRQVIASALTTVDLHDLSRLAATYELAGLYVVTPLEDQVAVAEMMIEHWCRGWGARYIPTRAEALSLVRLVDSLNDARADVARNQGLPPLLVGTSAVGAPDRVAFSEMGAYERSDRPVMIVLGTAWGLADEVFEQCDLTLEPIRGPGNYNHLSVRTAAGIILDRLLGPRQI